MKLRREFRDREELEDYCAEQFLGSAAVCANVSPIRGGRAEALRRLQSIQPRAYARTRNALDGAVTRLSPYLRHGAIELVEAMRSVKSCAGSAQAGGKLLEELAWRDYWRRVLDEIGIDVWEDQEPYKTGFDAEDYSDELPRDFLAAETGIDFVDAAVEELNAAGYLHNQLRMKIAA